MIEITRGTTPDIEITIDEVEQTDIVSLDAVFKSADAESAPALVTKTYPDGGITYDGARLCWVLSLTEADTRALPAGQTAYFELRVVLAGNKIPVINREQVRVVPTMIGART